MNAGAIAILVISLAAFSAAFYHPRSKRFARRESPDGAVELAGLAVSGEERRGILDCKQPGAACRGFPPCCSDNVCYWENGFSPSRPGRCVTCVQRGQMCQRDGQCCESLICQKETSFTVDGRCDVKRPLGAECHDNDQCVSEYCDIDWYNNVVMGHGGTCANP